MVTLAELGLFTIVASLMVAFVFLVLGRISEIFQDLCTADGLRLAPPARRHRAINVLR